jgi:hypothetical protein
MNHDPADVWVARGAAQFALVAAGAAKSACGQSVACIPTPDVKLATAMLHALLHPCHGIATAASIRAAPQ